MSDMEKMTPKKKWTDYQVDYNNTSKSLVHIIGTNISLFVCLLLPFVLIGFIWTEFVSFKIDRKFISDGIVTVALFIIGELMMMRVGTSGGKLDTEYISAKKDYDELVKSANEIGTMFMPMFCDWQIDTEMNNATAIRIRSLRITRKEWEEVKHLPYTALRKKYGSRKAKKMLKITKLNPVELNDAILLYNGNDAFARGGIPISGEEFIEKKTHSVQTVLSAIFTGLLTVSVVLTLTSDISFARVMYTVFKCILLLFRMAQGYDVGAKAYNTVEVKQLKAKSNYLRQYIRFVTDKTYLNIGSEYGDVSCYVEKPETPTVADVTPTYTNLHELTPIAEETTN